MGAALKLHQTTEPATAGEAVLLDCADRIRQADGLFEKHHAEWLDEVGAALQQAHGIHAKLGGPNSHWSKWLAENTSYSRNQANRIISYYRRKPVLISTGSLTPANLGQWESLAAVPDASLSDCMNAVQAVADGEPITARLIKQVAEQFNPLNRAREIAKAVAAKNRKGITVDDVQPELEKEGIDLGKSSSNLFRGPEWEWTGERRKTRFDGGHQNKVFALVVEGDAGSKPNATGEVVEKFSQLTDRQKTSVIQKLQADPVIAEKRQKQATKLVDGTVLDNVKHIAYDIMHKTQGLLTNHGPAANKTWLAKAGSEDIQELISVISKIGSEADRFVLFLKSKE